jgi:hypothetical protein
MARSWTYSALAALAGLVIEAGACATNHGSGAAQPPERVLLTVKNTNWMDMDVFAVRGGTRARVGSVTGLTTATLRVPLNFAPDGVLQFMVDPIGSDGAYVTEKITVSPGQRVELTIGTVLRMSTYAVWSR